MNRLCRQCRQNLPLERFEMLKEGTSWRRVCRSCRVAKYRKGTPPGPHPGVSPNGEDIRAATSAGRTCKGCDTWQSFDQYIIVKSTGNLFAYCNDCVSKRNKNRWETDKSDPVKAEARRRSNRCMRDRLKAEVLAAYGSVCSCCGEADTRFLTLDHVNDDGAAHRRREGIYTGTASTWSWARQHGFPDTLRLLCYNCNCGRQANGGTCPHAGDRRLAGKDYTRVM